MKFFVTTGYMKSFQSLDMFEEVKNSVEDATNITNMFEFGGPSLVMARRFLTKLQYYSPSFPCHQLRLTSRDISFFFLPAFHLIRQVIISNLLGYFEYY